MYHATPLAGCEHEMRAVTPMLALRVARFAGIAMELLAGQGLLARVCPHCGHPHEDFIDEVTWCQVL